MALLPAFKAPASFTILLFVLFGGGLVNGGQCIHCVIVTRGEAWACWPRVPTVVLIGVQSLAQTMPEEVAELIVVVLLATLVA